MVTDERAGLRLKLRGESFLLLSGTFDDLVAEVRIDVKDFQGTVGLAHHVSSSTSAVLFTVSDTGEARLLLRSKKGETVLSSVELPAVSGVIDLGTTSAGRHLKAFLNGKMILHGHGAADSPGHVGLYLKGEGIIRILSMTIEPEAGH